MTGRTGRGAGRWEWRAGSPLFATLEGLALEIGER